MGQYANNYRELIIEEVYRRVRNLRSKNFHQVAQFHTQKNNNTHIELFENHDKYSYTPRARLLNHWATKPEVCNQLVL